MVLAALLAACGGDDGGPAAEATTSTADDTIAAYCRLMERTDEDLREHDGTNPTDLAVAVRAEQERIDNAPPELRADWNTYAAGSAPVAVANRLKDWTQKHCGFLPTIG